MLSMSSISYIDEADNCATRFMPSCVLLLINWRDWGTLSVCVTPVGEGMSCRRTRFPSVLKPANSTPSQSLGRVRRSIGFDFQEPQRDTPLNGAVSLSSRHKRFLVRSATSIQVTRNSAATEEITSAYGSNDAYRLALGKIQGVKVRSILR